jgi:hypothetical protein
MSQQIVDLIQEGLTHHNMACVIKLRLETTLRSITNETEHDQQ